MGGKQTIEPSQFLIRYAFALLLIVIFVIGGHSLLIFTGKQGALDEEVINISGRQRMLSQRIVLLSHRYYETNDPFYNDLLIKDLDTFEASHEWLMVNAVDQNPRIQAHYSGTLSGTLDQRSKSFVRLARSLLDAEPQSSRGLEIVSRLERGTLEVLLSDLNTAVSLFEQAAKGRAQRIENMHVLAVVATLLVLMFEVVVIFYPAHKAMEKLIGRLKFQAWHDGLTGLSNRARFVARVQEMRDAAPENMDRMFILALDLDGFKDVNDTLGHPVGDQVLQRVAQILETRLSSEPRLGDQVVARIGGDEFIICGWLKSSDVVSFVADLGNDLIARIELPIPVTLGNGRTDQCMIGTSIGYAFSGQSGGEIDAFLSNADIALYESKRNGKGVATAFEYKMREAAERRLQVKNELMTGLKNFEFVAHFQPQIDLATGKLHGVEALARWDHSTRGLLGPRDFIAHAEEANLIDGLDGQVMLNAIEAFRQAQLEGIDLGILSLNASGMVLRDPNFCDLLLSITQAHDIQPGQLTVEVLENVLIQDGTDQVVETVKELSRAGIGVAIDDFGIGFSSLSRVSDMEISAIKIDRSLTQQVGSGNMSKILNAIAAMARGTGAALLAEGIETDAQRGAMQKIGVDIGQGFLWSRPMQIDELKQWARVYQSGELRLISSK